ncbi:M24 family metallopeptidase [Leptospira interrogans]|uniref:M24 family metallopeptidase n=1 Tax=Leptospira interrogans TaxID=173 RepID=UPI00077372B6|nr:M24 family metallopeptidase [Leptospira interrogans]OQM29406.1 aminopeptidase [Leptospira interrogans]
MNDKIKYLKEAQEKAEVLFSLIDEKQLIKANKTEKQLSEEIYQLAKESIGISKFWHKKIVRAGINSVLPYDFNPKNSFIQEDDIVWVDFGPIFNSYEADLGRTYVLGNDPEKVKIKEATKITWHETRDYYISKEKISGKELFEFVTEKALENGFLFGNDIAGHLIDQFSHNKLHKKTPLNYICSDNYTDLKNQYEGKDRFWVLEIHFINKEKTYGSFFEQLLI